MNTESIKAAALAVKQWSKDLAHAWVQEGEEEIGQACFGHINEDGVQFPVAIVDTGNYDAPEMAIPLANYYALTNPVAVLNLIAQLEAAQAELAACKSRCNAAVGQADALRAELAEARKGAEMMAQVNRACNELPEWFDIEIRLENGARYIYLSNGDGVRVDFCEEFDDFSDVLKSAIDTAIKAKEQQ